MIATFNKIAASLLLGTLLGCQTQSNTNPRQTAPFQQETLGSSEVYNYLAFELALRNGDMETFEKTLPFLLQNDPPEMVYVHAGRYYFSQQKYEHALELLLEGTRKYPENYNLLGLLVETYNATNQKEKALSTLNAYLAKNPEDLNAKQAKVLLLIRNANYPEAIKAVNAIPQNKRSPILRYYHAFALSEVKARTQAINELNIVVKQEPDFFEAWLQLARLHLEGKNFKKAEECFATALQIEPNDPLIWQQLIRMLIQTQQPDKALNYTKEAPHTPGFLLTVATYFTAGKYYEQAEKTLELATLLDSYPPEIDRFRAELAIILLDFKAAIAHLEKIPVDSALYEESNIFKAEILFELREYENALVTIEKLQKNNPDSPELGIAHGRFLYLLKRHDEAIAYMQTQFETHPTDTKVAYYYGSLLETAKKHDEAIAVMEKILAVAPEHAEALNFIGYSLAEHNKELPRALALIEQAYQLSPQSIHILDSYAWVLYRLEKFEEAWKYIKEAVQLGADDSTIWEHYAAIAKALGRTADARKGLTQAEKFKTEQEK